MWSFSDAKKCDCASYEDLTLDRKAVSKRIKQSQEIKKRLEIVADDAEKDIALFRCPTCGQTWQSGREWNFGNEEYLYRVPPLTAEEWKRDHYLQPAAMMIYAAMMEQYFQRSKFTPSADKFRAEGCEERASTISIFCRCHQVEALQEKGALPKLPQGRPFPPYGERQG